MAQGKRDFDAVVFDMDGVIFDSEQCVFEGWMSLAGKYGLSNLDKVFHRCLGTNQAKTRQIMLDAYGEDFPYEEYAKEASVLFHAKYDNGNLPMKTGVVELLTALKQAKKKVALATSSRKQTVLNELRWAGILDFFDAIVCGDMVEHSKPEPDIYLKACEELGVLPERAYAIEDSYNGIRSACKGRLHPIMVPDLMASTEEMKALSEVILKSLPDVKEYLL